MSSAYNWYLIVGYLFMICDIRIIYIINSKGPNTEPWGILEVTRAGFLYRITNFNRKSSILYKGY